MEEFGTGARLPSGPYRDSKLQNTRLLREDLARRALVFRGLPEVVTLNHTDLCNLRCVMCPRSRGQGRHRLDRAVLEHVAHALFPTAWKVVLTTSGGEPLAADFDLIMERALTYGTRIDVVTNGALLTAPLYRRARRALDHLNVSVDCHVPEVYEAIRAGARWSTLEANLQAVREERARQPDDVLYTLSAVVLRSNLTHIPDFVRFAARMGAAAVVLQRLQHEILWLPEHDPERDPGPQAVAAVLAQARAAARESGINLYLGSLGEPAEEVRPQRAKLPPEIADRGVCWFLAQQFAVMYTGEVYPCCVPTDHCLGNVLYEDPVAIWNGAAAQALRAAHVTGRGTSFCSGCAHAPHLPARPGPPAVQETLRRVRRAASHLARGARRRLDAAGRRPIFAPQLPDVIACDGVFADRAPRAPVRPHPHPNELLAVAGDGRGVWFLREGTLWRAERIDAEACAVARDVGPPGARVTVLQPLPDGAVLLGFQDDGRLLRVQPNGGGAPRVECVLELSDPRSYARQSTVALGEDGDVWVGEYGLFPGARCAHLYVGRDGGRRFERVASLASAKHVHVVHARRGRRQALVTTGDLPGERRLYLAGAGGGRPRCVRASWFGFTAAAETEDWLHFGSDMPSGNGLVRVRSSLRGAIEFRPFPDALDLQVRQIVPLGGGRLLATTCMDESLPERRAGRRAALLLSEDQGEHWHVVHRFAADWSDLAEGVAVLDGGAAVATICTNHPVVLHV